MDLECGDQPGLLSQLSAVMFACGIRIHDAKIATLGEHVEDTFIMGDQHNAPLGRKLRADLKQKLIEKLGRV